MSITKKYYLFTRKIKEEAQCTNSGTRDGITRIYYRNGSLKKELLYKNGRKEGPARRLFKDGSRFEFECIGGREKVGRWRNYDQKGFLVMEKVYSHPNELLCELYYEYGEYGRIVTLQWTRFLDDEIEKYKQYAREYDELGNPGFPVTKREQYTLVDASTLF